MAETDDFQRLSFGFDDLLIQTIKAGLTHAQIEGGTRYEEFRQVGDWNLRYGYKFNIYSNDHLIDGKKHFHLDNDQANIHCKFDFEGNIIESKGKNPIPANILKEVVYFVKQEYIFKKINELWDKLNP